MFACFVVVRDMASRSALLRTYVVFYCFVEVILLDDAFKYTMNPINISSMFVVNGWD